MNICLIGNNLSNLVLAKSLLDKKMNVDLYYKREIMVTKNTRTIGISESNINFINYSIFNLEKISWPINEIKVFNDTNQKKPILNFESKDKKLFSIVKYDDLFNRLSNLLKKKKNFKRYIIKKNSLYKIKSSKKYDLIINSDKKNSISEDHFFNFINKDYNSTAYTTLIKHDYCKNNMAFQIFTKIGPLAFLPLSNNKTSVVFSAINQPKNIEDKIIKEYIKKYNINYKINSISKIQKFKLIFSFARKYYHNNILLFGDALHQIHPLTGQGFNMTMRDIQILLNLIDEQKNLGLPLDKSLLIKFENKIKHLNFIFASGVDFIHEFFIIDNKLNNSITKNVFKFLDKSNLFNHHIPNVANRGIIF